MGQIEIYELLKELRMSGDDSFYPVAEIKRLLQEKGESYRNAGIQASQLEAWGNLESTMLWEKRSHGPQNFRGFRYKRDTKSLIENDSYCQ